MANESIKEVVVNGNTYPIEADTSELKEQVEQLNDDLTATYDKTTGKWYERNADGSRGSEISIGSQLSCIKYGTVAANTSGETVYLGQTIPTTDYIVLLDVPGSASTPASFDSNGYFRGNYNNSYAYMSAKTTTSFKITSNVLTSYQVVKLK